MTAAAPHRPAPQRPNTRHPARPNAAQSARPAIVTTSLLALMAAGTLFVMLSGCASTPHSASDALPSNASPATEALASAKDSLDAADAMDPPASAGATAMAAPVSAAQAISSTLPPPPAITGHGYSQISGQPGATLNEKRINAMRAARMDALRDLVEQIHGIRLTSETTIGQAVLQSDRMTALVEGTMRGARTVSIQQTGSDSYTVVMAVDADTLAYLVRALAGQI